jgi:hypothetical protein
MFSRRPDHPGTQVYISLEVTCWVQHFLIHRLLPLYLIYYDGVDGIMLLLLGKCENVLLQFSDDRVVVAPHTQLSAVYRMSGRDVVYAVCC